MRAKPQSIEESIKRLNKWAREDRERVWVLTGRCAHGYAEIRYHTDMGTGHMIQGVNETYVLNAACRVLGL